MVRLKKNIKTMDEVPSGRYYLFNEHGVLAKIWAKDEQGRWSAVNRNLVKYYGFENKEDREGFTALPAPEDESILNAYDGFVEVEPKIKLIKRD